MSPYIPNRFEEGYGANAISIGNLKSQFPNFKLLITVDNGIVANEAVDKANELGIDVIITDHHQVGRKLPQAFSIIHTDKLSGSGIAWILSREIARKFQIPNSNFQIKNQSGLDLCAIGTIADQIPLIGPNRSFVKFGLEVLNTTTRPGLLALFKEAGIVTFKGENLQGVKMNRLGTYEVNYVIAPRINAMGRLEHAIDSLRLLCTTSNSKARELAQYLGRVNRNRQNIVDKILIHARELTLKGNRNGAIVIAHETYHEVKRT